MTYDVWWMMHEVWCMHDTQHIIYIEWWMKDDENLLSAWYLWSVNKDDGDDKALLYLTALLLLCDLRCFLEIKYKNKYWESRVQSNHLNLRDLLWRMLVFLLSVSTTSSAATLFSSPSPSNVSSEKDSLGSVGVSGGEQLALSQKRKEEFRFGLKGVIFRLILSSRELKAVVLCAVTCRWVWSKAFINVSYSTLFPFPTSSLSFSFSEVLSKNSKTFCLKTGKLTLASEQFRTPRMFNTSSLSLRGSTWSRAELRLLSVRNPCASWSHSCGGRLELLQLFSLNFRVTLNTISSWELRLAWSNTLGIFFWTEGLKVKTIISSL